MENNNLFIPIILGTAREERKSKYAASFMLEEVQKAGIKTELLDVKDYRISATDNTETLDVAKKFKEKVVKADGFIIITPEYNHGYPGELKMMLDMLYPQFAKKAMGICGVSAGELGGARVVEQLRLVAVAFHMMPIGEALYFSNMSKLFNESGEIQDPAYGKRAQKFLEELAWYAKALKVARESELD